MKSVGIFEAKTNFSQLLEEVEEGENLVITRYGQPIARITQVSDEPDTEELRQLIEKTKEERQGRRMDHEELQELRHRGHRY